MNRTLGGDTYREARRHLYSALYYRKTSIRYKDSINLAIQAAPANKKTYLEKKMAKHL